MFEREQLLAFLKNRFRLDWNGPHGIPHWARVKKNGLELCDEEGGDRLVVELFAWLHDIERENDEEDIEHGQRAAILIVEELLGGYFNLNEEQSEDLIIAVRDHSKGFVGGSTTVRICWDADRLDLGRCGILPDCNLLCTDYGKSAEMIRKAHKRAIEGDFSMPDNEDFKY